MNASAIESGEVDQPYRVFTIASRSSIEIPLKEMLLGDKLDIDPSVLQKGYFTFRFAGRVFELVAGGYCGLIPINSRFAIDVRPKMPAENLAHIFDVSRLSFKRISGVKRSYDGLNYISLSIAEFLGQEFLQTLKSILETGLLKAYIPVSENTGKPRGRIDFQKCLTLNWPTGKMGTLATSYFDHRLDIPLNRVLNAALQILVFRLQYYKSADPTIFRSLAKSLGLFVGIGRLRQGDESHAKRFIEAENGSAYDRYQGLIRLSLSIIAERGVSVQTLGSTIDLTAVVIDFDDLFESYVRNSLKIQMREIDSSLRVLDGNREGSKKLYDDKKDPKANPDIVISKIGGTFLCVIEVKYKAAPDRDDVNQALAYALIYRVTTVILVHQAMSALRAGLRLKGRVQGVALYEFGLDLSISHLEQIEVSFARSVASLIDQA